MNCHLCPVNCGVDRTKTVGRCLTHGLVIAKAYRHPYEEPPISYKNGSGTVFFCGCNLKCVFCQNASLSRMERGKEVTPKELAEVFRALEEEGAENINLVTPDHVSPLLKEALSLYRPKIPIVYNSSGYATIEALQEIDPYVDVYLPDLKFFSPALSERYTGRRDYFTYASKAIEFMAKKPIRTADGKLLSGILVRHLIMPSCTSDSLKILDFLHALSPAIPLSLMRQYTPMDLNSPYPELNRKITAREYERVLSYALALGFDTVYTQEKESADPDFIPNWDF